MRNWLNVSGKFSGKGDEKVHKKMCMGEQKTVQRIGGYINLVPKSSTFQTDLDLKLNTKIVNLFTNY
jgi:hypothetical protein